MAPDCQLLRLLLFNDGAYHQRSCAPCHHTAHWASDSPASVVVEAEAHPSGASRMPRSLARSDNVEQVDGRTARRSQLAAELASDAAAVVEELGHRGSRDPTWL